MKKFEAKYFPQSHFCNKIAAFLPSKQYSRQNSGNLSKIFCEPNYFLVSRIPRYTIISTSVPMRQPKI